ncbi:MAG: hypothetical protein IPK82_16805 [Polyangiaceae bacterium]|nr:hypothetical protein [Polyangiaceae bacterium]
MPRRFTRDTRAPNIRRTLFPSLFATLFALTGGACDDGGTSAQTSSGTGASTTGAAGSGGTAGSGASSSSTGTAGSAGTSGNSGSTGTAGTGGMSGSSGTAGTGGMSGSSGSTGGMATGGTAGSGGTSGTAGSTGSTTSSTTSTNSQPGNWGPPPAVQIPPLPPAPDYSGYPKDSMGRPILSSGPNINWVVPNVPDAMSARELCADLVANCFEAGVRSLDACFMSAPHCTTSQPWTEPAPCCADDCFVAYANQRKAGTDPFTAYLRVLYEPPICMPGVDLMLQGGAP